MINWDESSFWTSTSILRVGDLCLNSHLLCAGVWTQVLEAIGVLAVIANGLVIGVSSDFVPRLVYRYRYGPCATGGSNTQSVKNRGCEKKSCHLSWVKSPVVTQAFFFVSPFVAACKATSMTPCPQPSWVTLRCKMTSYRNRWSQRAASTPQSAGETSSDWNGHSET